MYSSKDVIKRYQAGIAMPTVIIVVAILVGLGAGGYFFFSQERKGEAVKQAKQEKPAPRPFLGGWKVEKVFGLDAQGQWSESAPTPYKPTYVEFDNEDSCVTNAVDLKCESYLAGYQVNGDIMSFPGATGSRFRWKMADKKLELIYEVPNDDVPNDDVSSWNPLIKFISVKVK